MTLRWTSLYGGPNCDSIRSLKLRSPLSSLSSWSRRVLLRPLSTDPVPLGGLQESSSAPPPVKTVVVPVIAPRTQPISSAARRPPAEMGEIVDGAWDSQCQGTTDSSKPPCYGYILENIATGGMNETAETGRTIAEWDMNNTLISGTNMLFDMCGWLQLEGWGQKIWNVEVDKDPNAWSYRRVMKVGVFVTANHR
ncbi:hypothetical protein BGX38DRAFT_1316581 [Terfezia claveryi]|nr:hypothetical protein BGX38DRAFT_1316581 [Terfezia claveryi]